MGKQLRETEPDIPQISVLEQLNYTLLNIGGNIMKSIVRN